MAENPHEKRAQALAEITQMQQDLVASAERIQFLERQLRDQETIMQREINKQEARAEVAERNCLLYRAEAHLFRSKLVQMATTVSLVRKATEEAEKIAVTINNLLGDETQEQAEQEEQEARDLVAHLPAPRGEHVDGVSLNPNIELEIQRLLGKPMVRAEELQSP